MSIDQLALSLDTPIQGRSRKRDPQTSRDAARTCDAQRQKDVLLRELRAVTVGRTCDELESVTGIPRYVVASRLAQMRRDGLCEAFGLRPNQHGRNVQIWHANYLPRGVVDVRTDLV